MSHSKPNLSIGMFDSGVGGLTVMKQMLKQLPNESIVYFGDTARVPYGGKSRETIIRYSIEGAIFLMEQNIKLLIFACHTASAHARDKLKLIFNIPVIDVIEPGVEKAVQTTRNGHIAVLGTKATIRSGVYQNELQKRLPHGSISAIACPLFVPLIEENFLSHNFTRMVIREYLQPLKQTPVDTVLLGCTHYPLIHQLIQDELGPRVQVVDPAQATAQKAHQILSQNATKTTSSQPSHRYYVSDDPEKFRLLGESFLGIPLGHVQECKI